MPSTAPPHTIADLCFAAPIGPIGARSPPSGVGRSESTRRDCGTNKVRPLSHSRQPSSFVRRSFPQQTEDARNRERRDDRENRMSRVGFNGFKQVLDHRSHIYASVISRIRS
jgi:hypothetical protein